MQAHFGDIPGVKIALDDVLVAATSKEECQTTTLKVLDRVSELGMTLNKDKCEFVKEEIVFFGIVISAKGIKPKANKFRTSSNAKSRQMPRKFIVSWD
jgi:hypothetical protein